MSTLCNTRRDFLKEMGLGATLAVPALGSRRRLSADEKCKSVRVASSRPSKNDLGETEVLVVGGGPMHFCDTHSALGGQEYG